MWFILNTLTINDTRLRTFFAFDCYRFAFKFDIAVTIAGICAGSDKDGISVICIVNRLLYRVKIGRGVVIDVDDFANSGRAKYCR